MYSKARLAGHPIHPMIVSFPIAFYTATVATLLAYLGTHEAFWFRAAMVVNIAGIATAVIAMIPGAIDLWSLPAMSLARRVGLRHAGFNSLATGLFAVTALLLYRGWTHRLIDGEYVFDATLPLVISVVAWVSMVIGGWLGWTLVQTHHVGIKRALTRPDRSPQDPELVVVEAIEALEALDALDAQEALDAQDAQDAQDDQEGPYPPDRDTLVDSPLPIDDLPAPPRNPPPSLSMRH